MARNPISRALVTALTLGSLHLLVNHIGYFHRSHPAAFVDPEIGWPRKPAALTGEKATKPVESSVQIEWETARDGSGYKLFGISGFQSTVDVASINIKANPSSKESRPVLENLSIEFPTFSKLQLGSKAHDPVRRIEVPETSVTVEVAQTLATPNAAEIIFSGATTLRRLTESLDAFKHWAAGTGARFVIVVEPYGANGEDPGEPSGDEIIRAYAKEGIELDIVEAGGDWTGRYVSLLDILPSYIRPDTQWIGFIDDDTFFFSMHSVLHMLHKYDASEAQWVGTHSEYTPWLWGGGINCVGGAGFFLSTPLLKQIGGKSKDCLALANTHGDKALSLCIYKYTTTKLSVEHGLYQLEMFGDPSGFYEAVRPQPISTHHWKSWHQKDMAKISAVSRVCGDACILQSYRFADGWLMTNGYSIVKYSYSDKELASQNDFDMEHSWDNPGEEDGEESWRYSFAPLKPKDTGKTQFLLENIIEDVRTGTLALIYVKRIEAIAEAVIRVVWSRS
ncbi:hypothetical protein DL762_005238 [Monosporascus cannonballus]|uniref:Glycosyltransferase family 31 protein n=1 Tax=Monosporascus cannonballus TaxID=155416 RepID=A0ABY0H5G2_9PEZI|nr:hypothetical protein DL762_005238 [Monosporascus cannonballus]RYO96707.1 hypothetical protein DL763_003083 [Monosporascus cannonballus]